MSSCIMKMSKVVLAFAILFSVTSDRSGSQCEALVLSNKNLIRRGNNSNQCADENGKLKNCYDFVSSTSLKGHIYRLKTDTLGRTAFNDSYCVKNKVPGFADGVKAALGKLRKSTFGTRTKINEEIGRRMLVEVTGAVLRNMPQKSSYDFLREDMKRQGYVDTETYSNKDLDRYHEDLYMKRVIAAVSDIRRIAKGIFSDESSSKKHKRSGSSIREAVSACYRKATSYLEHFRTQVWSKTHDGRPRWSGPFVFDNSYCVKRGVLAFEDKDGERKNAFEEEMRLALGKLNSSAPENEVKKIFNKVIERVEYATSLRNPVFRADVMRLFPSNPEPETEFNMDSETWNPRPTEKQEEYIADQKAKNAIAAASDIDLIVKGIEADSIQRSFFQDKLDVLDYFQTAAKEYLTKAKNRQNEIEFQKKVKNIWKNAPPAGESGVIFKNENASVSLNRDGKTVEIKTPVYIVDLGADFPDRYHIISTEGSSREDSADRRLAFSKSLYHANETGRSADEVSLLPEDVIMKISKTPISYKEPTVYSLSEWYLGFWEYEKDHDDTFYYYSYCEHPSYVPKKDNNQVLLKNSKGERRVFDFQNTGDSFNFRELVYNLIPKSKIPTDN